MKKTTWLLLALAIAVVWGAFRIQGHSRNESPTSLLNEARELLASDPTQVALAQRMLDRGLSLNPPNEIAEQILIERAELRTQARAFNLALEDWETLAAMYPDDLDRKLQVAIIESKLENHDRSLEIYSQLLSEDPKNGWVRTLAAWEGLEDIQNDYADTLEQLTGKLSQTQIQLLTDRYHRIVRLPASDPVREGLILELEQAFDEEVLAVLTLAISEGSQNVQRVRSELVASLETSVNAKNLFGLIDLVYRSGRLEDTVEIGRSILRFDEAFINPVTLQRFALALSALDRPAIAATAMNNAVQKQQAWPVAFLPTWCSILYQAENWPELEDKSGLLMRSYPIGSPVFGSGAFFLGISLFHQDRDQEAIDALKRFIGTRIQGPFPDAIGEAWATTAEAWTKLENQEAAAKAWKSCSIAAPAYSAKAWLEVANETLDALDNPMKEAIAVANAIAVNPSLMPELMSRFEAAGQRGFEQQGVKITTLASDLQKASKWYPDGQPDIYTLFALAQYQIEVEEYAGAAIIAERSLVNLPRFLPAIDQLATAEKGLGNPIKQAEMTLTRLAISGPDPEVFADLKNLAAELEDHELPATLLRRWMEIDPEFIGALELARALESVGQPQEAFQTLTKIPSELLSDRDRILLAEIMAGLDQQRAVLTAVLEIPSESPLAAHGILLRIQAAALLEDQAELSLAIDALEDLRPSIAPGGPEDRLIEQAFAAMLENRLGQSLLRFSKLISDPQVAPSGRHVSQEALAEAIFGDYGFACDCADAADALVDDGSPIVGRLVLAESREDSDGMLAAIRDLRAEAPAWLTETNLAFMAGIEGRIGETQSLLSDLLSKSPQDSRLWLAKAAISSVSQEGSILDPLEAKLALGPASIDSLTRLAKSSPDVGRHLLITLLAFETPVWRAWAADTMRSSNQAELLGPFATELLARYAIANEQPQKAKGLLNEGGKQWKGYLPFWDLNEDLALDRYGRADHPVVVALRSKRRRLNAPPRGGLPPSASELALDASFEAASKGREQEAFEQALLANTEDPLAPAPRLNLARTAQKIDPAKSQTAYLDFLVDEQWTLEPEERNTILAELLSLPTPISRESFEALAKRFPEAPEPILGLAMLDQKEVGLAAAFERMEAFTLVNPALESLSLGASRPWFDFLLRFSPQRALDFAEAQLDLDPHWLQPWIQVATALDVTGNRAKSLELWRTLSRMTADSEVALQHASLVANMAGSHDEVRAALKVAEDDPEISRKRLSYINALSLSNLGSANTSLAITRLEKLLEDDSLEGMELSLIERRLGTTLIQRASIPDMDRAAALLKSAAEPETDALERDVLIGLSFIAKLLKLQLKQENADRKLAQAAAEQEEASQAEPASE